MLTSTSISAPLPPLPSKRKLKPKAPNTAAIWESLAGARGDKGKGKEKEPEQDKDKEEDKEKEFEKEKKTANEKENANGRGEKDINGKEVSLPIDPIALRAQTKHASLQQPVTSILTQRRKKVMGTATTISENNEKQAKVAPLSINGHASCPSTPLLDESISTSLSRRSNRLKELKPPPEPAKLKVGFDLDILGTKHLNCSLVGSSTAEPSISGDSTNPYTGGTSITSKSQTHPTDRSSASITPDKPPTTAFTPKVQVVPECPSFLLHLSWRRRTRP
jgi:hypothetical protein